MVITNEREREREREGERERESVCGSSICWVRDTEKTFKSNKIKNRKGNAG